MRVVTLEEHIRFSSFTRRFDQSAVAKRGFSLQARQPGMENWARQLEDLGEDRLKSMDESGITVQVVSVLGPGADLIEGDEGAALAREYNNAVSDKIKLHPNRFAASAHLLMANPATAADELARTVKRTWFLRCSDQRAYSRRLLG